MTHSAPGSKPHVLLLAYYFPPMGLSGVQRVSKFAKYLPAYGWDVTVVTASPGGYFAYDESLADELSGLDLQILRTWSLDPTRLFPSGKAVRLPEEKRRRLLSQLTHLLFVPDNKLGWYPFARRAAIEAHRERPFNVVFSSAPPYTSHMVARAVADRLRLPFVVDFRDDWLGNPRHKYPTALHRRLHDRIEARVLGSAAACVTINTFIADSLRRRSRARGIVPAVTVIPQGFDPSDFPLEPLEQSDSVPKMRLLYSGVFYDVQTPEPFLDGLQRALAARPDLRNAIAAEFVGLVPPDFSELVASRSLADVVEYHGYETHAEVVSRIRRASVLWLTIGRQEGSEGISTGKLYEYLGSRKPILGLVPDGVARDDLRSYGAAEIVEPDNPDEIADAIQRLHERWASNSFGIPDERFVEQFDRRRLTGRLASVLEKAMIPTEADE